MQLNVQKSGGSAAEALQVSPEIFGRDFNEDLVHQVVTAYMAGARAGTKAQKTRAEVSGGGIKPWRQKGTGRARAGTIRSPLWRHGGKVFAAKPRDYAQKVNRKQYRVALRVILSELVRQERLVPVADFALDSHKTRDLAAKLKGMGLDNALIVTESIDQNLYLAARNLPNIGVCDVQATNPVSLIGFEKVVMTVGAIKRLEEMLA